MFQYNLSAGESPDLLGVQNVTIPGGIMYFSPLFFSVSPL